MRRRSNKPDTLMLELNHDGLGRDRTGCKPNYKRTLRERSFRLMKNCVVRELTNVIAPNFDRRIDEFEKS